MYTLDRAPSQDQEKDEMEDQESTPDQEGDMNNPDGFISRM